MNIPIRLLTKAGTHGLAKREYTIYEAKNKAKLEPARSVVDLHMEKA